MTRTALDLHGVKHEDVDSVVENFVLCNQEDMPLKIIYGNSESMRRLVVDCLSRTGFSFDGDYPYGALFVVGYEDS